ncbi:MAG: helicase-associated domain-containing protein, partial [Actinobacteria bacterium]|nr:helicase-associated domain-containing protein [Actinomycetota bacterium]
ARVMVAAPSSEITLQADLTAVAAGSLEVSVARDLGAMADVESRGAATVYRFSEASVRRALDGGRRPEDLLAFLEGRATRGVPQPLAYLISDVGRRHGSLRVGAASCYVRSDDPALVAQVLRCRPAARLGLRQLAPTVLVSSSPVEQVLEALRKAGLLPAQEAPDGAVITAEPTRRRAPAPRLSPPSRPRQPSPPPARAQLAALVGALRASPPPAARAAASRGQGRPGPAAGGSADRRALPAAARGQRRLIPLADEAVHDFDEIVGLLATAADLGAVVEIGYGDCQGRYTERTVEPMQVGPDGLVALCHLRDDERSFALERIEWARMA